MEETQGREEEKEFNYIKICCIQKQFEVEFGLHWDIIYDPFPGSFIVGSRGASQLGGVF